jgi:hypothetical protein
VTHRIFKYELEVTDEQQILLPEHARILSVQVQNGRLCLWALVNDGALTNRRRTFRVVGTGHPVPDNEYLAFLGTVQMHGGALVFHVFEKATP